MQRSMIHFRLEIFRKATLHCVQGTVFAVFFCFFLHHTLVCFAAGDQLWASQRLRANHLNIDPHTSPSGWMQILHLRLPADERHQVAFLLHFIFHCDDQKQWRSDAMRSNCCLSADYQTWINLRRYISRPALHVWFHAHDVNLKTSCCFFNCTPQKSTKRVATAVREQGLWRLKASGLSE